MAKKIMFWLFLITITISIVQTLSVMPKINNSRVESWIKKRKVNFHKPKYCSVNFKDKRTKLDHEINLTTIYFVTPTFPRPEQIPDLTRLSHTLMHVPKLHWLIADDNNACSNHILNILRRSGLPYTFIASPKPHYKRDRPLPAGVIPRGVPNRRAALSWIHQFAYEGILYFGDDDNTYDLGLFEEIRKTKKLSMFPVGLIGLYRVSSPVVSNGTVIGFFDSWLANRKFPVDMAGFAVNLKYLNHSAVMPYEAGMLEDKFLTTAGFEIKDIEPLADNCTKVLVWHTQTYKHSKISLNADIKNIANSKYERLAVLLRNLIEMNVIKVNPNTGIKSYIAFNREKLIILSRPKYPSSSSNFNSTSSSFETKMHKNLLW